jgi:DNA sulfur modification protein DndC
VEAGFDQFAPLIAFRDWLASIRNDPSRRSARRRDGRITVLEDGKFVPGPYTLETRGELLDRVLALQDHVGRELISPDEISMIRMIWAEDALASIEHRRKERISS